jgi:hypothetical protein
MNFSSSGMGEAGAWYLRERGVAQIKDYNKRKRRLEV